MPVNKPTTLTIETRPSGVKVLHIRGDLDSMGTQTIEPDFIAALSERTARAVVDLSHVGFMSSAGMALLLVQGKILRQGGGKMCIAASGAGVLDVLLLAGFHELFDMYPTVEEALAALETA